MCGVAGILSSGAPVNPELLLAMRNSLQHRGPDDAGIWISPDNVVGLVHVRLAIIDLSPAGHQPMSNTGCDLQIVFNGEIYNYQEVRDTLERMGHRFRSFSDTEVILEAYRAWGTACLKEFNGMFAFCLYDAKLRRIFLARDRAGEKPLYYCKLNNKFTFSSELQALLLDPELSRRIDPAGLNSYLAYGYVMGSRSMITGVEKLPAGSAITYEVDTRKLEEWQYWHPPKLSSKPQLREEELTAEAEKVLKDSVRLRLIADVPVGVMLSGGLDSSLVTALAAEATGKPIKTFSVTFPGHTIDESPYSRLVAKHFGTEHHELVAEPSSMDLLPYLAERSGEPIADYSLIPVYQLSKKIREHVTVALGGDGGDELFGGYPYYNWLQMLEGVRRFLPLMNQPRLHSLAEKLPPGVRGRQHLLGILRGGLDQSLSSINQFFDPQTRCRLLNHENSSYGFSPEQFKRVFGANEDSLFRKASLIDFQTYLVEDILTKVDRASMLNSLEVRAPFLDHRLIELCFAKLPDSLRVTKTKRKILLKKLAKTHLPASLDVERKQGFFLPLGAWFKGAWGSFVKDVLLSAEQTLFDHKVVLGMISGQQSGLSNGPRLYALTMFELWRRHCRVTM
jgi:asparagine synthase (glutamine-hydrolysing)